MSYDNALRQTFTFTGLANATTTAAAAGIRAPAWARGAKIVDIQVSPTAALVGTTTPGVLQVGTAGTSGKFAAQNSATVAGLAVGLAYGSADLDGRVAAYSPDSTAGKGFIDLYADGDTVGTMLSVLKVGTVASTGGTPAGTYTAQITIDWF